jgi:hypothetical protein
MAEGLIHTRDNAEDSAFCSVIRVLPEQVVDSVLWHCRLTTVKIGSLGGWSGGETPGLIPNPAVKPSSADGTWGEAPWESRSLPREPSFCHCAASFARSEGQGQLTEWPSCGTMLDLRRRSPRAGKRRRRLRRCCLARRPLRGKKVQFDKAVKAWYSVRLVARVTLTTEE